MRDPRHGDAPFDPALEAGERDGLTRFARKLERERPVPRAGFRDSLGRRLLRQFEPRRTPPRRLQVLIAAYAGSGVILLAVAALGVAGVGPLGP